jgi:hypothetical protein
VALLEFLRDELAGELANVLDVLLAFFQRKDVGNRL